MLKELALAKLPVPPDQVPPVAGAETVPDKETELLLAHTVTSAPAFTTGELVYVIVIVLVTGAQPVVLPVKVNVTPLASRSA